jgi:triphosphoribosyl-dephospho-CoA synthase
MRDPRPHDLIRLKDGAWAVVRRAYCSDGAAVGFRGRERSERYAARIAYEQIEAVVAPEELAAAKPPRAHAVFDALRHVMQVAEREGLVAGPIGAAGFELATGVSALHDASDLDVLVRATPSHGALPVLAAAIAELPVRVDIEVAFANDYGVALAEALSGGELLVKTPGGPRMLPRFSAAQAAVQALVAEAELTPKPALVDRRGSGAHDDLTLALLVDSAHALHPAFDAIVAASRGARIGTALREELGVIGRAAEAAMLETTGGINTHRGAIWTLGLLLAGHAVTDSRDPGVIAAAASQIAALPDAARGALVTHGEAARRQFGVRGATGEALAGFPHALERALPALRLARSRGARESVARIDALLTIIASIDDTCVLHRGGAAALRAAQDGAAMVLEAGGYGMSEGAAAFSRLENALLCLNASPGGAADQLAAALFLDSIERGSWA